MTWFNRNRATAGHMRTALGSSVLAATLLASSFASAQVGAEEADTGVKGAVGGALLGAEAVMFVEAMFDVQPWWAYAIGGGLGAIGGGIGGYFLDQEAQSPAASMGFLVAGLVLAVPTTIAVLDATSYEPAQNPVIDDGDDLASRPRGPVMQARPLLPSVACFEDNRWALRFPAVQIDSFKEGARPSGFTQTRGLTHASASTAGMPTGPALTAPAETTVLVPVLGMSF